jgi:hypothetical protein
MRIVLFLVCSSLFIACTETEAPTNPTSNPSANPGASSSSGGGAPSASSSSSPPPTDAERLAASTSGVDPAKKIGSLSPTEKGKLCDWSTNWLGGYGARLDCGGMTLSLPKDQAACVEEWRPSTCDVTVAQYEACTKVDAPDPCALKSAKAEECAPIRKCMGLE